MVAGRHPNAPDEPRPDDGAAFQPAPVRIADERARRLELARRALPFHHAFLDDYLRGIRPHDLVLLGAETGAGKTDIATMIARENARQGRRVHYFALEAESDEIERRIKYALLAELATQAKHPMANSLTYVDWLMGHCEDTCAPFDAAANQIMLERFGRLKTYYRGERFGAADIERLFRTIHTETDLIALDHLHYVDSSEDENENRALGRTVKLIRYVALSIGRPVLLVAHLRKRDQRARQIVPHLEDFHGSSDLIKNATTAVLLAPARSITSPKWYLAPTFIYVPKHRPSGWDGLIALCWYDRRFRRYTEHYTLGRAIDGGTGWEPLRLCEAPRWAKYHREMEAA